MKYILDNDLHIHSQLSLCSNHPLQTTENILKYGEENSYTHICLTDHYWDENIPGASQGFYVPQNTAWVTKSLPLPQSDNVKFHFGCETDMDMHMTVGISDKMLDKFEFIIIPTTHLHMVGFAIDPKDCTTERRAEIYVERFARLLEKDLPWEKIGIAHMTCSLLNNTAPHAHIDTLNLVKDDVLYELFAKASRLGAGIELNFPIEKYEGQDLEDILRIYRIAKKAGCKFYFGSDAHGPEELKAARMRFEKTVDALELEETDKFMPFAD